MAIPRERGLDNSIRLFMEGFNYIPDRRRRFGSDIFQDRLMGQKVVCMGGEEAAELFYDEERFKRKGVALNRIKESLFGKNGVQGMDGAVHKHRKQLFMSLMTHERIQDMIAITQQQWQVAIDAWQMQQHIVLFEEVEELMCRIGCQWAGVPLFAHELKQRTEDLSNMIDAFGAVGPRHWRGRAGRNRSEQWMKSIIEQVRGGRRTPQSGTALYAMAWHRDLNGQLLDLHTAAVEVLNIIRPIVAIGRYVTFGALAMYHYPDTRAKLQTGDDTYSRMFVQEVRRFYPFGPYLGAKVRADFQWSGHRFKKGDLVLLDIYGTNHDPDLWEEPEEFKPERFKEWGGSPFDFIPQGGGDYDIGHRCAGEWVTIEVMNVSLAFLANRIDYNVLDQDLRMSLTRVPPIPKSRFIITDVIQT